MSTRLAGSSFVILVAIAASFGQAKPVTQEEYKEAVQRAADMTEKAYPVAIAIEEAKFRDSRQIEKGTFFVERVSKDRFRMTMQMVSGGKTTNLNWIGLGRRVYCKVGDGKWERGPSEREWSPCEDAWNSIREPASPSAEDGVKFTSENQTVDGERLTIYRKSVVYAGKHTFFEQISTVNSKGFMTNTTTTVGTLDPRTVTVTLRYSSTLNAKIAPIVEPKVR